eukprot:6204241-Pleurochrysis_carterae.AAC.1
MTSAHVGDTGLRAHAQLSERGSACARAAVGVAERARIAGARGRRRRPRARRRRRQQERGAHADLGASATLTPLDACNDVCGFSWVSLCQRVPCASMSMRVHALMHALH